MTLQQLSGRVAYLPGANNLGVIATGDGGAIIVDSGIDKDAARGLKKALVAAGLTPRAIISTHHHADHVGGNAFLLKQYPELQVYATPFEAALIQHPLLEPIYLSGGATPPAALRGKWVLAPGSPVHHLLDEWPTVTAGMRRPTTIAGVELELLGLPGHSPAQIGVLVDGVCLAADGFFGPAVLAKHGGVPYTHDVAAQLASLAVLGQLEADWFVPGHGAVAARAEIGEQLAANEVAVRGASDLVRAALNEAGDLAEITSRVLGMIGHSLAGVAQYAIFSGAVGAHLTYLEQQGEARLELVATRLIWSAG